MEPWSEEETVSFVKTALTGAACGPDLFMQKALQRLHELSEGLPRRVQQLAQLCVIAAAAQDLEEIDEETLDAVHQELSTQPAA